MKYLLDSGMGDELQQRGFEVPDWKTSIWSVSALIKSPNGVVEIHKDNIKAGCNVIITNNYYVTPNILKREGIENEFESLTRLAVALAEESRQGFPEVLIAGSFPPIETSFRPDLTPSNEVLDDYYSNLGSFIQKKVDLILCETMGSIREGLNAAKNALEFSDRVWLSWTNRGISGDILPSGEKLKDAVLAANQLDVECQLVNCCAADLATKNIETLKKAKDFGVYANSRKLKEKKYKGEPVHLLGSGSIMQQVINAQKALIDQGIPTDVWSVTSYNLLHKDYVDCQKSDADPFLVQALKNESGHFIAVSDYMRLLPDSLAHLFPGNFTSLGTDGYGLSESREELRNYFGISTESIVNKVVEITK